MKFTLFLCLFFITSDVQSISEKQMKATLKLLRNTCQTKAKVSSDIVDAMHTGDFRQGQCYVLCLMETYKFIVNGEFRVEDCIKTIKAMAPPSMAESAIQSVTNCKDAIKTKDDQCAAAAEIAKCIYEDNPEKYFLP